MYHRLVEPRAGRHGHGVRDVTVPLVTAFIPSYNNARFLPAALDSVSQQTFRDFELIIVDDSSSDESVQVIQKWLPQQPFECKFITHTENRGLCRTVNEILATARGRYLACVASDDRWCPDFLETFALRMNLLPDDVAVLYGDIDLIDEDGRVSPHVLNGGFLRTSPPPEGHVFDELWRLNFVPAIATMCRTEYLREIGGYDEGLWFEDWDMWLRLADKYAFAFQPGILAQHRIVSTSMTGSPEGRRSIAISSRQIRLKWFNRLCSQREAPEEVLYWPNAAKDLHSIGHPAAVRYARKKWHLERTVGSLMLLTSIRLGLPSFWH